MKAYKIGVRLKQVTSKDNHQLLLNLFGVDRSVKTVVWSEATWILFEKFWGSQAKLSSSTISSVKMFCFKFLESKFIMWMSILHNK